MSLDLPAHSWQFRLRRIANWLPMGLAYAFLYMGRYNLTVAQKALGGDITKDDFGQIFAVGAVVYGVSFLVNGPLVDRYGGRRGMLIGVFGAILANLAIGVLLYSRVYWDWDLPLIPMIMLFYACNMYFQSFGAVSIVTVKAPWFHVHERGSFSTIFGIIISAGIYFAFDWGNAVVAATRAEPGELDLVASVFAAVFGLGEAGVDQNWMLFFIPSILMGVFWIIMFLWLRNTPGEAGFADFDTAEASLADDGKRLPVFTAVKKILTHPVLLYVCLIEFCSGVLRNGIMHWYYLFGNEVGFAKTFPITANWGLALLICGIIGANATGWVSDKLFNSRRAPMSAVSYALMILGVVAMSLGLDANIWIAGLAALAISTAVIAVHGILSGTATADFGGSKNTGIAVGIVDGFVYLGTAVQSLVIGKLVPTGEAAKDPANWLWWPIFLIPFAIAGFFFTLKIWNALPTRAKKASH
ncbi:MAG: MFS transporter [Myxococcota bacterium]|jgi:OPA family glycerol-3-phosphate transporter-like MFS transporter|nr:MFS transporter [Myxococcota bacterium]